MVFESQTQRHGVSLLEVLISIGVIALGIFGVASLIPVAQFQVAQGTKLDRISALGPSAAAEFRIRGMGSPRNWVQHPFAPVTSNSGAMATSDVAGVQRRGFVIDPLGVLQGSQVFFPSLPTSVQPMNAPTQLPWVMPRLNLRQTSDPNLGLRAAQQIFYLTDDVEYDRPTEQTQQPRRQYLVNIQGRPVVPAPNTQLSWFATLSPVVTPGVMMSDEFLLSIVICEGRTPDVGLIETTEHDIAIQAVPFPGEVQIANDLVASEMGSGDWVLIAKSNNGNNPQNWVYRWTQIVGTSDKEFDEVSGVRTFSLANDDLIGPGEVNPAVNKAARMFFVRGVQSVFERTVRIQNTTAWDG